MRERITCTQDPILMKFTQFLPIVFFLAGTIPGPSYSQEVIEVISTASCECIEELETPSDFAAAAEICIQQAIFSNLAPILEEFEFNITDEEEASRIGEKIGMEVGLNLVSNCPAFMEMMMASDEFEDEYTDYEGGQEVAAPDNSEILVGTFLGEKVTKGGFSYLLVKDEYGVETELLWMNPFLGDELISEDLEGQKVTIKWKPAYIRNGKAGEYIKTKVISELEE